ncbi:MAG: hypothetical protein V3V35_03360 [Dehalococcoidia bacterium]
MTTERRDKLASLKPLALLAAALLVSWATLARPASTAQAQPTWQVVTIPNLPAGAGLGKGWASAPDDVYVWAQRTTPATTDVPEAFLFHWDGTTWSMVLSLPGHAAGNVFGTGSLDVFAAAFKCAAGSAAGCGADRGGRIFRSTDGGSTWTPQVLPAEVGVKSVGDISGTPGNVHAEVAASDIIRFDGSAWQHIYMNPHGPYSLTLLSANEGYYVTCWGWGSWDGVSWSFNGVQFDFCDVWNGLWGTRDAGGALHLYAAGNTNFERGVRVWKFNEATQSFGSKCGFVFGDPPSCPGPSFTGQAHGIWGSAPDDIYVAGRIEPGPNNGRVYHYDGTAWQRVMAVGDIPTAVSVWGTGPDDVWVALADGRLLHLAPPSPNTPIGPDVTVPGNGGLGEVGGVELTFSQVTGSGDTTVVTSTTGPPPPTGLKIVGLAGQPVYYDITTTAVFGGPVAICIRYDVTQVAGPESNLRLMHQANSGFDDITVSVDTVNDIICGETTTLSLFAIMESVPVGGIVEVRAGANAAADASGSAPARDYVAPIAGGIAVAAMALAAGGWYAVRRWRR